ncbi:sensor histidine kinase [Candidatus Methylobacter oryzae]|uniref:histidine kinase n=1 Tax=Candidatus Methylobacter oryzae TaxID=2497749 RepID=A0ABY3CLI9_9GAMM|nr:CHASE3 domain-containing protein [Candidatus Methylobacter oryzae]TRX02917.1 HAMP domain-containing protein [Candidatus Methylobacter oryzae]
MKTVPPLSTHTITASIWRLVFIISVFLAIFFGLLYWSVDQIATISRHVERTEVIERELHDLLADLLNAETGQRGYLLTLDEDYLEPYYTGITSSNAKLRHLQELITIRDAQNNLERMRPLIQQKSVELDQTISLAKQGQTQAALNIVQGHSGKQLMDELRLTIDATINIEMDALSKNRTHFMGQLNTMFIFIGIGSGLAFIVIFTSAVITAKRLGRPVAALLNNIETVTKGELNCPALISSNDEIGQIADAFNHMREHLLTAQQERGAAQKELERSNAELDNFAYVASHDLKAPLRGIRNLAEWIAEDIRNAVTDDTHENVRLLRSRVDRLDGLLESLLAYSRVGRKTTSAEAVDSGALISEISEYLAPPPGFAIACEGEMPILFTPKAPLEQVLRNLINNAIKHHDKDEGRIVVSAVKKDNDIEFHIKDDGPGIAPEFHKRIFQMFQTLKPRDQVEGSGMGLAIVQKTIENFGGCIRVESDPPHRGTTFVFTWPKNQNR